MISLDVSENWTISLSNKSCNHWRLCLSPFLYTTILRLKTIALLSCFETSMEFLYFPRHKLFDIFPNNDIKFHLRPMKLPNNTIIQMRCQNYAPYSLIQFLKSRFARFHLEMVEVHEHIDSLGVIPNDIRLLGQSYLKNNIYFT